jgi:uncharacterized protein YdeI (YjbR/CyaY-like superfamily)
MTEAKKGLPIRAFKSSREWAAWLDRNHAESRGVWLRYFKKDSGVASINYAQALDEALCHGWIDGQGKKHDDKSWLQKYTPRRPGSVWSKRNTRHAARLIKAGRMRPHGFKQIEAAKADGRWKRAYDSPSAMRVPDDFIRELSKDKRAKAFFETLNKANTYAIAWRLQTAKKPETRQRRMKSILEMLARGEKFH